MPSEIQKETEASATDSKRKVALVMQLVFLASKEAWNKMEQLISVGSDILKNASFDKDEKINAVETAMKF